MSKLLCHHISKSKDLFWFRIFGFGLHFKKSKPLFSERHGYKKLIQLGFGWRTGILR